MSRDTTQNSGGNSFVNLIVTLVVLAALFFLFRYIWHGIVWAFNEYVGLLKVK